MASDAADDTDDFKMIVHRTYPDYEKFLDDFRLFQQTTCTSFYIYNSRTANICAKTYRHKLPKDMPYYFVKFCCVHRKRKGGAGARYKNHDCQAFVTVRASGTEYQVAKFYLVHSHSFQRGNESLYVGNRRLTAEQESQLYNLIPGLRNSGVREYARCMFNRTITNGDICSIRKRYRLASRTDTAKPTRSLNNQGVCAICGLGDPVTETNGEVSWVQCNECRRWYHCECAGYTGELTYHCAGCGAV